ncbi:MAG: pitrilysin family protein [bacterium]|nr:pitrilysin family protein [bacterium]
MARKTQASPKSGSNPVPSTSNPAPGKLTLSNGVRVLVDKTNAYRSISLCICLVGGSSDETIASAGLTHLLEHLLFKRTKTLNPREIACRIDYLGGEINAFTDSDSLCLHAQIPQSLLEELFAFISSLLLDFACNDSDLTLEQSVIRQEILEAEDDPSDSVYRVFAEHFWPSSMLALPVYGTKENVQGFKLSEAQMRLDELLCGQRLLIAAAGNIELEELARLGEKYFGCLPQGKAFELGYYPTHNPQKRHVEPKFGGCFSVIRPVSQVHLLLGRPWPSIRCPDYYTGLIVSSALGSGMSSRLFQLLREEKGLAYDIAADIDAYPDTGALLLSGVIERKNINKGLTLIHDLFVELLQFGLSDEEHQRVLSMLTAQLNMEFDSLSSRMWRLLESELYFGEYRSTQRAESRLRAITADDIARFISHWLPAGEGMLVLGGDIDGFSLSQSARRCYQE